MAAWRVGAVAMIAVCAVAVAPVGISSAGAASSARSALPAKLAAVYGVTGQRMLYVSGVVRGARGGSRVTLETRAGKKIRVRAAGRVRSGGRFSLQWRYPTASRTLVMRVRVGQKAGAKGSLAVGSWRTIDVRGIGKAARRAPVKTSQVISVPDGETGGQLVLSGRPRVRKGDVVALGVSRRTPSGVLQRITAVSRRAGGTVLDTTPASIPDVIPAGSMDVALPKASARPARAAVIKPRQNKEKKDSPVTCTAGQSMKASADVDLTSSTRLEASWRPFQDLKAKFTGTATARAAVEATISGAASCTLEPVELFARPLNLGTYTFSIAGIPIVLKPEGQIYLSGTASVRAQLSTSASASLTASAGVAYENGKFQPFGNVTPQTSYSPPTLSAGGNVALYAAPAVYVRINGLAGPELDLKSGLELAADTQATPWWTLSALLSGGVKFKVKVWKIDKESKRFEIFNIRRLLASATGPFGGAPGVPPPPLPGSNPRPPTPDPAPEPNFGDGWARFGTTTPDPPTPRPQPAGEATFDFTGGSQQFVVPAGVSEIDVEIQGAQGDGTYGGLGGRTRATLPVTPGETLEVNVGGAGRGDTGGFNGGGEGDFWRDAEGAGGGATDIRRGARSLNDRIAIAAGGGGGVTSSPMWGAGGSGGGTTGQTGGAGNGPPNCANGGGGGTPATGGASGGDYGSNGTFGSGAPGGFVSGGGGGGWYGGGSGGSNSGGNCGIGGGGGAGSSYVSPTARNARFVSGYRFGEGLARIAWPAGTLKDLPVPASPSNFDYSGKADVFYAPGGAGTFGIELAAGSGDGPLGGGGGRAKAKVPIEAGQPVLVFVGEGGKPGPRGSWNGGGRASYWPPDQAAQRGAGGGATDIRVGGWRPSDRVLVAGGGGGASVNTFWGSPAAGGNGGGLAGGDGKNGEGCKDPAENFKGGEGGTQTSPGRSYAPLGAEAGNGPQGGNAGFGGGGGGGGWFGGGAGGGDSTYCPSSSGGSETPSASGAGGGSGYAAPAAIDAVLTDFR